MIELFFLSCAGALVLAGWAFGFYHGTRFMDSFRLWGCSCARERACLFYGTRAEATSAAKRCRGWNKEPLTEVEIEFDQPITDLRHDRR